MSVCVWTWEALSLYINNSIQTLVMDCLVLCPLIRVILLCRIIYLKYTVFTFHYYKNRSEAVIGDHYRNVCRGFIVMLAVISNTCCIININTYDRIFFSLIQKPFQIMCSNASDVSKTSQTKYFNKRFITLFCVHHSIEWRELFY